MSIRSIKRRQNSRNEKTVLERPKENDIMTVDGGNKRTSEA